MADPPQVRQCALCLSCWQKADPSQARHLVFSLSCWQKADPPQGRQKRLSFPCTHLFLGRAPTGAGGGSTGSWEEDDIAGIGSLEDDIEDEGLLFLIHGDHLLYQMNALRVHCAGNSRGMASHAVWGSLSTTSIIFS